MKYNPGDKVVICDASRAVSWLKEGMSATVIEQRGDRLYVIFDGEESDRGEISGNVRRFRLATKLDKALK